MADGFDPYYKWLGIHPKDQPPHHYRLLGVELFESDPEVIEAAADRHVAYLQDAAAGPHVRQSQRLLNEIAVARLCLLDERKKRAYDEKLRTRLHAGQPEASAPPAGPPAASSPPAVPDSVAMPVAGPRAVAEPPPPPVSPPIVDDVRPTAVPPPNTTPASGPGPAPARPRTDTKTIAAPRTKESRQGGRQRRRPLWRTSSVWLMAGASCLALTLVGLAVGIVVFPRNPVGPPQEPLPIRTPNGEKTTAAALPAPESDPRQQPTLPVEFPGGIDTPSWNPADLAGTSPTGPGLVARYTFDDPQRPGSDETGTYPDAFPAAQIEFDAELDSRVLVLNGESDRFDVPRPVQDDFTIALWIRTRQQSDNKSLWHMGPGVVDGDVDGPAEDYGLALMKGMAAFGVGSRGTTTKSQSEINDGLWHHVAVTREAGSGQLRLFVDGRCESECQAPRGRKDAASHLTIGCTQSKPQFFHGRVDDIRFYNYVLPDEEIRDLAVGGPR